MNAVTAHPVGRLLGFLAVLGWQLPPGRLALALVFLCGMDGPSAGVDPGKQRVERGGLVVRLERERSSRGTHRRSRVLDGLVQRGDRFVLILRPDMYVGDGRDHIAQQAIKGGQDRLIEAERQQILLDGNVDLEVGPVLLTGSSNLLLVVGRQPVMAENEIAPPEPTPASMLRLSQFGEQVTFLD